MNVPPKIVPVSVAMPEPPLHDIPAAASAEGVALTRRWFETWNRGELDAFIDLYSADAEMTPPPSWLETGALEGRSAIRRFFEGLKESWEGKDEAVLGELIGAGDRVVSRMEWRVRGRASGIETHIGVTNVTTIEGGKIIRQRHYLEHDEAIRARPVDLGAVAALTEPDEPRS